MILVAEDNVTNQNVIRRQLNLLGYAAEMTDDGKQALEAVKSKNYAVLLTDCHMPEMDGFDLTKEIRKIEQEGDVRLPIIAITASVLAAEIDRCYEAGMDDSLAKPLEMPKLKAALRKWMPAFESADVVEKLQEVPDPDTAGKVVSSNGEGPIDPSALKDVFGDDEDTFREILQDFVEPAQIIISGIEDAYEAKSAAGVGAAAHKLKSSSRAVGANALADLCAELEGAGKSDDWDAIEARIPHLNGLIQAAIEYIKAL
ncbi:MAG: response regulator [Rhodospirillales bacterium]|nr:response regulator [Rhodospirillales bacterium]